ncbi:MAG: QueT transporter family protein [Clostridiales bacterium]|nr:QueT transporter family protein [Clostridia bacterium]MCR4883293.1 QueT transporter family protein [Clostridiales bacterium]
MFRRLLNTRSLCFSAMIAALYAVITLATPVLSYGAGSGWECRLSEALTMLAVLFPEAVPGLTVGCLVANLLSPVGPMDIIFGTLATLIAAIGTWHFRSHIWLAALCPILSNAVIVGLILSLTYGLPLFFTMLQVGAGEAVAVLVGCLLLTAVRKSGLTSVLSFGKKSN